MMIHITVKKYMSHKCIRNVCEHVDLHHNPSEGFNEAYCIHNFIQLAQDNGHLDIVDYLHGLNNNDGTYIDVTCIQIA